jgi:hypothetical protein
MSDFHELVGTINRVRNYVRDFFISGWRSRSDYDESRRRSYDNEKCRVQCWFGGEYAKSRQGIGGRQVFSLSADMDDLERNPMYEVWRAKRFLPNDLSLHFFLLDMLSSGGSLTLEGIMEKFFPEEKKGKDFEISTVATKLREYAANGIILARKEGRRVFYSLSPRSWKSLPGGLMDAVDFFTEAAPLGVIGSFIQDEAGRENRYFRFRRHFIVHTLEDEVLLGLLDAIRGRLSATLSVYSGNGGGEKTFSAQGVPLKILTSVQGGRRYVAIKESRGFFVRRLDRIHSVKLGGAAPKFDEQREKLDRILKNAWGVMFEKDGDVRDSGRLERIELRLSINERREKRVLDRLMRERRNGTVERERENVFVYRNELWYAREMMPFVKSFTGHILSFECDNEEVKKTFCGDMERMSAIYGEEGEAIDGAS